jgi:hypothetical protein
MAIFRLAATYWPISGKDYMGYGTRARRDLLNLGLSVVSTARFPYFDDIQAIYTRKTHIKKHNALALILLIDTLPSVLSVISRKKNAALLFVLHQLTVASCSSSLFVFISFPIKEHEKDILKLKAECASKEEGSYFFVRFFSMHIYSDKQPQFEVIFG